MLFTRRDSALLLTAALTVGYDTTPNITRLVASAAVARRHLQPRREIGFLLIRQHNFAPFSYACELHTHSVVFAILKFTAGEGAAAARNESGARGPAVLHLRRFLGT